MALDYFTYYNSSKIIKILCKNFYIIKHHNFFYFIISKFKNDFKSEYNKYFSKYIDMYSDLNTDEKYKYKFCNSNNNFNELINDLELINKLDN